MPRTRALFQKITRKQDIRRRILLFIFQIDRLNNRFTFLFTPTFLRMILFAFLFAFLFAPTFSAFIILFATTGTASIFVTRHLIATRATATAVFTGERRRNTAQQTRREHTDFKQFHSKFILQ